MLVLACTFLFTIVIHTADSLSYALRLGGLRARRIGLALTVAGMLLLVSRTSNMIQGPMLGSIADQARR
ncbi:lipid II flippase family protein [Paenibacillus medicaginis]|uniref:Lipid II flippase family protein n=1 Tax=Paenibacillus medicaginis TaxID=1470560 RepID=A0ABV5BW05_9BACL